MSKEHNAHVRWRAKLIPRSTPMTGLPDETKPLYGDIMSAKSFETWKNHADDDETKRLGSPAFLRTLVPVDDEGKEIPEFSAAWWAAMFAPDDA